MNLSLKVVPQSGRQKCVLDKSGQLKCYLKSPPEDGKANKELIGLFAEALGIPKNHISIVQGLTSRNKIIAITGNVTMHDVQKAFNLEVQHALL